MSPQPLRRYRAERLLGQEFEAQRGRVLARVRGRLRASGVSLDASDLEACYAQAWQGLYAACSRARDRQPPGWLVLVTFRRAIDEHRARRRAPGAGGGEPTAPAGRRLAGGLPAPHGRRRSATSRPSSTTARACASCSRGCAGA